MVFSSSRKKKTAPPVIQEEKIENSERDESRVDAKRLGGKGAIHKLKFHKNASKTRIDKFH